MSLSNNHDRYEYDENLSEQRADALTLAILLGSGLAFAWLVWLVWPMTGSVAPASAWMGSLLLILCLLAAFRWRETWPRLASQVFLWGFWLSIVCAVYSYPPLRLGVLFFPPLILAANLVEWRDTRWLALACLGGPQTRIKADFNGTEIDVTLGELAEGNRTGYLSGFVSPAYCFHKLDTISEYSLCEAFEHEISDQGGWYTARVIQKNGQGAWSSPVWV